ncbi:MAG: hypothetical protein RIS41_33 [Actinomycetota bacterium]|jgi:DNA-binding PadR family transcriptional regulator
MTRPARAVEQLLLGEWACLGVLADGPSHGFAIASRLRPDADLGRIWSLSRPLTYRAIDQLLKHGYAEPIGEERGIAGGTRTVLAITESGRTALREWLNRPVLHLRDLRSELLLKLALSADLAVEPSALIDAQRRVVDDIRRSLSGRLRDRPDDIVSRWRLESAEGALRFLDSLTT